MIQIHIGAGPSDLDLPAWIQAGAALIAVGVTAWQWWQARQDARRERAARLQAGLAVIRNVVAALAHQSLGLKKAIDDDGHEAASRYAGAIFDAGFGLLETSLQTIDVSIYEPQGVEAVLAARSALHGVRLALDDLRQQGANGASAVMAAVSVDFFASSVRQIEVSANMLAASLEQPRRNWFKKPPAHAATPKG